MNEIFHKDNEYREWLSDLKSRIRQSQIKASVRINSAMLELYWSIGADIAAKQAESKWGSGVLQQLSSDLRGEFPNVQGFSERNLWYMKKFYTYYSNGGNLLHQLGAETGTRYLPETGSLYSAPNAIHQNNATSGFPPLFASVPWRHHVEIISRSKSLDEALFYVGKTVENGWSRAMLLNHMDSDLYSRRGMAINNFSRLLPEPQGDLAREIVKDPYQFDFITLTEGYKEREMEDALTANITAFLLELGQGFAYVGRQVPVTVGEKELFIDLLFYHLELRCYVVIELKAGEFEAEHAGKLGVYVSAINHGRKNKTDNPTIGIIICKSRDRVMAEYAVESSSQPIGISEYELSKLLPDEYKSVLPSIEAIEEELAARANE